MKYSDKYLFIFFSLFFVLSTYSQKNMIAPRPLYRDPIYDGAADPVVIWNKKEKKWFMFYTNRRANVENLEGVTWVHGTKIGIAESTDGGKTWYYRDTANINYRRDPGYTFWAPEVIEYKGIYHMYLTYVPGTFNNWQHPRYIIHLTSKDLLNWEYQSTLKLSSEKVIDACVLQMPDGKWRLWYNNEADRKSIYYAESNDLYNWEDKGKAVSERGEGPVVFYWKNKYWMIIDVWRGLAVYSSDDLLNWKKQEKNILEKPGIGLDDKVKGGHPDVIVQGDKAYIFYFTHPGRYFTKEGCDGYEFRRSSIQVAELLYDNGSLYCNRDLPVIINLNAKYPKKGINHK